MTHSPKSSLHNIFLSMMFLGVILTPLVGLFFSTNIKISKVENRNLTQAPTIPVNMKELQAFPGKFDSFFSDHFGFRDPIIRAYNFVKFKIGDSPTDDIMIGKEGWLYLGSPKPGNKYQNVFDSVINMSTYDEQELENIASNFQQKRQWLADQGIAYLFVMVPEKHSVYPEYLPDYAHRSHGPIAYIQIRDYLRKNTNIKVVDFGPAILKRKKELQVYNKTDTHWNHEGAFVAYKEIMDALNEGVPKLRNTPAPLEVNLIERERFRGDISNFIGLNVYDEFNPQPSFSNACSPKTLKAPEGLTPLAITSCDNQKNKLLLYGDSFADALMPYLSKSFATTTYVRDRPLFEGMKRYIEQDKPDLVIEEWAERKFIGLKLDGEFTSTLASKLFENSTAPIQRIPPKNFHPNNKLTIKSLTDDTVTYDVLAGSGYIHLANLEFSPNSSYVVKVDVSLKSQSLIQLYFADSTQTEGYPYSNARWLRQKTYPGEASIHFLLNFKNLGSRLRIHPTLNVEEVSIKSIQIREVEMPPIPATDK